MNIDFFTKYLWHSFLYVSYHPAETVYRVQIFQHLFEIKRFVCFKHAVTSEFDVTVTNKFIVTLFRKWFRVLGSEESHVIDFIEIWWGSVQNHTFTGWIGMEWPIRKMSIFIMRSTGFSETNLSWWKLLILHKYNKRYSCFEDPGMRQNVPLSRNSPTENNSRQPWWAQKVPEEHFTQFSLIWSPTGHDNLKVIWYDLDHFP